MQSLFNFIIKPKQKRYDNKKLIGDKELIVNSEISDHRYVSRVGVVLQVPKFEKTEIKVGDEVIVHHNVFRRWHDVKGKEKNSRCYWKEDKYIVSQDQIYLYKKKDWVAMPGYSFVKPIKSKNKISVEVEEPLVGVVKYTDGVFNKNQIVGFTPGSEFEFIVEGQRLYRVMNKFITIKYEYQGDEKEYNPSWAQSS